MQSFLDRKTRGRSHGLYSNWMNRWQRQISFLSSVVLYTRVASDELKAFTKHGYYLYRCSRRFADNPWTTLSLIMLFLCVKCTRDACTLCRCCFHAGITSTIVDYLCTIVHLRSYELKELGNCSRSRRHVLTDAILFWCIVDFVFRRCHHSLGAVSDRLPRCWAAVCPSRVLGPGTGTYSGTTTLSTIIRHLTENESFFSLTFRFFLSNGVKKEFRWQRNKTVL